MPPNSQLLSLFGYSLYARGAFRPLFRQLQIGRQWRPFVNNAEASRDTRVKSIAYELSNWDNSKQAAYSTDKTQP